MEPSGLGTALDTAPVNRSGFGWGGVILKARSASPVEGSQYATRPSSLAVTSDPSGPNDIELTHPIVLAVHLATSVPVAASYVTTWPCCPLTARIAPSGPNASEETASLSIDAEAPASARTSWNCRSVHGSVSQSGVGAPGACTTTRPSPLVNANSDPSVVAAIQ